MKAAYRRLGPINDISSLRSLANRIDRQSQEYALESNDQSNKEEPSLQL
ncbi:MAG: hypothetical protein ACJAYU_005333 [Bradymonadia bacterium]|jgi:hypothetical protein